MFHYATASADGRFAPRSSPFAGPEDVIRLRAGKQALNLLRLQLQHGGRKE